MFSRSFQLFRLFGFPVRVDISWIFIALLVSWSLAAGVFPQRYEGMSTQTYWIMGIVGMLGLFASVVLHEMAHSKVAQAHGTPMKGITLFIFGGVAEMKDEPSSPRSELLIALAGPGASVVIAVACFGLSLAAASARAPLAIVGVLDYLWTINLILVAFNLVPAFPLDGGRVLRSILWHFKGNLKWATRITSSIGSGFGLALIGFGILALFSESISLIGGLWWMLIGMFLRSAASGSYQQLLVRRALEGEPIRRFMQSDVHEVPADATVQELVDDYFYRYHHKMFPVVEDGRLVGCVTSTDIKELPRDEWSGRTVREISRDCSPENTIPPDADSMQALSAMHQNASSRLMVVENGKLEGIVSLKDLLKFISIKVELESDA